MSAKKTLLTVLGAVLLLGAVGGSAYAAWLYKQGAREAAAAAASSQPEPAEAIRAEPATTTQWTQTSSAIGTVRALRSITLRNELAGTVRHVKLSTGQRVDAGDLLVEMDVAVEQAQLAALQAEARLAESMLGRMERALERQGAPEADVDRARAERDMAVANVQRLEALIEQKRLRAPFDAVVGLVDLHVGQYLQPGTEITTLQGVADSVHCDFPVTQEVARALHVDDEIEVFVGGREQPVRARIEALDARIDAATRNRQVRAVLAGVDPMPRPGASVRVRVPVAAPRKVVVVPVSALRRGPAGNSVFVVAEADGGQLRAAMRRVTSGAVLGDLVVIERGVDEGELIATTGSFKLRQGALVVLAAPESTGPESTAPEMAQKPN